jgi:hypothetical protein
MSPPPSVPLSDACPWIRPPLSTLPSDAAVMDRAVKTLDVDLGEEARRRITPRHQTSWRWMRAHPGAQHHRHCYTACRRARL